MAFVAGVIPIIFAPLSNTELTISSITFEASSPSCVLFLPCKTATSVAFAAIVIADVIAMVPATDAAPKVATVATTLTTIMAVTATMADSFSN